MYLTEMLDLGLRGVGSGRSLQTSNILGTLAWAQEVQEDMAQCMSALMLGHKYLVCRR